MLQISSKLQSSPTGIPWLLRLGAGHHAAAEVRVHQSLHRLERAGLLTSGWSAASGRKRRIYELTRRGQRRLEASRTEWRDFAHAIEAVLA